MRACVLCAMSCARARARRLPLTPYGIRVTPLAGVCILIFRLTIYILIAFSRRTLNAKEGQLKLQMFLVDLTSSPSIRPRERESKISFPPAVDRDDDFSASGLSLAVGDGPAALRPQPPQIYCAASSD